MSLSVIGAGFGRTGTLSLKLALEQLGYGPCYHMLEVFKDRGAPARWEAAADGRPDWERIFRGYHATVDWPAATFWRELAAAYPAAKVVLTVRDPEAWFASTQATIFKPAFTDESDPWTRMVLKVVGDLFDRRLHDKAKLLDVYTGHNETVRRAIPPERLLVYEVSQGWAPLCQFLGVPAPDGPMPKVNTTEDFQREVADRLAGQAEAPDA